MENVLTTARNTLVRLNEIQPAMSVAGLESETDLVAMMKRDMAALIHQLSGQKETSKMVTPHHVEILKSILGGHRDLDEVSEAELKSAIFVAECFVMTGHRQLLGKS